MLEGIVLTDRESPERFQAWIEALGAAMDAARRSGPCRQEAHEALGMIARIAAAGRAAVGEPRLVLAAGLPVGLRRINGGGR